MAWLTPACDGYSQAALASARNQQRQQWFSDFMLSCINSRKRPNVVRSARLTTRLMFKPNWIGIVRQ
jgi:hypothetical protein